MLALEGDYLWGTSADVPAIVPYIREVLRVRRALKENLWWASIVEPDFAEVTADGPIRVGASRPWDERPPSGTRHALVLHHFEPEPMKVAVVNTGPGVTCPTAIASSSCASRSVRPLSGAVRTSSVGAVLESAHRSQASLKASSIHASGRCPA